MPNINTVCFDFGGVFTLSPFGAVELVAHERGCDPISFSEIIFGPYHLDTDHPWHRLERGEISLEQCRSDIMLLSRDKGSEVDLWDVLLKMANGGRVVNDQIVKLLIDVKQAGYHTAIITNNVKEFSDSWKSLIPMQYVDSVTDSAYEGIRKPSHAIFERALTRLSLEKPDACIKPESCVFLDDVISNVEAAKRIGMRGIVVTADPDQTVVDLKKMIGL